MNREIFKILASVWLVARWGTTGEAEQKLEEKIEEVKE